MAIHSTATTPVSHPRSHFQPQMLQCHFATSTILSLSFSTRRRRRRNTLRDPNNKKKSSLYSQPSSSENPSKLQFILDVDQLKSNTPLNLLHSKFQHFIDSASEAYDDLRTLVTIEPGSNRVVVSCSEKSVRFVGGVLVWSCVGVVMIRVLVKLGLGFTRRWGSGIGGEEVIKRRDRSLGGKEVVVAKRVARGGDKRGELVGSNVGRDWELVGSRDDVRGERRSKLPSWWPETVPRPVVVVNKEEYQREANQLTQAIMDDKLRGKDVSEEDILELHRICKVSGVRLSFGTDNARDSLYRLSVHNVINTCCKARSPSVQFDSEDARCFLAGLAHDVGLTSPRAATIVSAAVAAQTRQRFIQAWALEMQAKRSEAMEELMKICLIHHIFPPEPASPEMEMVARGLQKHLTLDQREFLLNQLNGICGKERRRSAAEALGLV